MAMGKLSGQGLPVRLVYLPLILTASATLLLATSAGAWDSAKGNPGHPTHSYLTEWGIDQLKAGAPELQKYRGPLVEGANEELHELPVSGTKYGIDLEAKRKQHRGSNAGCDDIQGWWQDSLAAYRQGKKDQAYFLLGIMLHMVEDMGVPAHANRVYHQGNATEFDNFEYMALSNWRPSFKAINRNDPGYSEPWKYYAFSEDWTKADAPDYKSRNQFSKTWTLASQKERDLLSNREGRTCYVVKWALNSAVKAFPKGESIAGWWLWVRPGKDQNKKPVVDLVPVFLNEIGSDAAYRGVYFPYLTLETLRKTPELSPSHLALKNTSGNTYHYEWSYPSGVKGTGEMTQTGERMDGNWKEAGSGNSGSWAWRRPSATERAKLEQHFQRPDVR